MTYSEKLIEDLKQAIDLKEQAIFKLEKKVKEFEIKENKYQSEIQSLSNAFMNSNLSARIVRRLQMMHYKIRHDTIMRNAPIQISRENHGTIDDDDIYTIERAYQVKFELHETEDEDRGVMFWYEVVPQ